VIFAVTSFHVPPASLVTCTFPSSVPAQITPGVRGDSEIVEIVQNSMLPFSFSGSFVVRSGLISCQLSPRFTERSSTCAPR
jgi:hypothetical protein